MQMLSYHSAERKGHTICLCELQIGNSLIRRCGQLVGLGEAFSIELRQVDEAFPATTGDVIRSVVAAKELVLVKVVGGHQRSDARGDPWMPSQRGMLRPRELQTCLRLCERRNGRDGSERAGCPRKKLFLHASRPVSELR